MKTHMIDDRSQSRKSHICRCRDECKKILRYGHLRTHLLIYSEEKCHAERLRVWISTYSITVERIHTVAQNAKRYSDRLEASALICSFILERSCTHVDSVTNHSFKLKL